MENKNMNKDMTNMTVAEMEAALSTAVNSYNESWDSSDRAELEKQAGALVTNIAKAVKFNTYAAALREELPLVWLIKLHHYSVKSVAYKVVDTPNAAGRVVPKKHGAVKDTNKNVDIFDFLNWCEDRNRSVAHDKAWKSIMSAQLKVLSAKFKEACDAEDEFTISRTFAGNALAKVFDALVFIPCENCDKNALMPNKHAKLLVTTCAAQYRESISDANTVSCELNFLTASNWKKLVQSALYIVLENKEVTLTFGEPEVDAKPKKKSDKKTNSKEATDDAQAEEAKK
jgi:hypothetical protein